MESAVRAASVAVERIDVGNHSGVHPRLGALDVLPFVPLEGATLAQCVELAHQTGHRIWDELRLPVYFYEAAALNPGRVASGRRSPRRVRSTPAKSESEANDKRPDVGGPALHPTAGAAIVGARKFLIAFNVNLNTSRSGTREVHCTFLYAPAAVAIPAVKALGLSLASRGLVQVSMNFTDFEQTPPAPVFHEIRRLVSGAGVEIAESELIGLIPRAALVGTSAEELMIRDFTPDRILENRLQSLAG